MRSKMILIAVVLCSCVVLLAACGNDKPKKVKLLNPQKVEANITQGIVTQLGANVTVQCPKKVAMKSGGHFTCSASNPTTRKLHVAVTQKDGKGNVTWKIDAINSGFIEQDVKNGLKKQKHRDLVIACPDLIELKQGDTFNCTATDSKGGSIPVHVTQTDDAGHVAWAT